MQVLEVGDWRLDAGRNELRRGAESVRLEPKAVEVLAYLARQPGEVVGREELLAAVWPGVVVGDDALTQAVIKLRKAMGDDAHAPRYIETISKRGYRLVASVGPASPQAPGGTPGNTATPRRRVTWAVAAGLLGAAVVIGFLALPRIPWPLGADIRQPAVPSLPTVAILPLANLSGDPKREYFSDGVTEDVINALGRFSGVRVMAIGAVQGFKGKAISPREIREQLGARYVVQGSVREADGKLRVTVALSDGEGGAQLWSERFEGEGAQIFEIQDRVARNIVGALHVKVSELEQQRGLALPAASLEAHDLVLRARDLINRTSRIANREARAHLARAAELSPSYAEVPTELGRAEYQRLTNGWVEDAASSMQQVEALARKALASPDARAHARAHSLLAALYSHQERPGEALAHADKAIELNASDSMAHYWRGTVLMVLGRLEEAIAVLETARRFEPHPTAGQGVNLAIAYYVAGRYPDALAQADALLVHATQQPYLRAVRAATLAQMGRTEEARAEAERVRLNAVFDPDQLGSYLGDGPHKAALREGLSKAGL